MRFLLAGWLLLTAWAGAAAAQTTLAWRFDEGQQLRIRLVQTTHTRLELAGKTTELSLVAAIELRWRVRQVAADGTLQLLQTFTRLYLQSAPVGAAPVTFDSASPEPPPEELREFAAAVQPLLVSRLEVALSPRGEVLAVRPAEGTADSADRLPDDSAWKELLSPAGMNRMLRQALGLLPAGPVTPGDCWEHQEQLQTSAGPLRMDVAYCYEGTAEVDDRPVAIITATADIGRGPPPGAFDPPRQDKPSQRATYRFDSAAGHLVESHVAHTLTAQAAGDPPPRATVSSTLVTRIADLTDAD